MACPERSRWLAGGHFAGNPFSCEHAAHTFLLRASDARGPCTWHDPGQVYANYPLRICSSFTLRERFWSFGTYSPWWKHTGQPTARRLHRYARHLMVHRYVRDSSLHPASLMRFALDRDRFSVTFDGGVCASCSAITDDLVLRNLSTAPKQSCRSWEIHYSLRVHSVVDAPCTNAEDAGGFHASPAWVDGFGRDAHIHGCRRKRWRR